MGRGNWWVLASPVQVLRKGKGDMEGLSPACQASTGGCKISWSKPINVCRLCMYRFSIQKPK